MRKGKTESMLGVLGLEALQDESERSKRMIAAEDSAVAKTMGWDMDNQEDDSVRQTALGDIVTNHIQQPKKSVLGTVAAIALGAAIPGLPIAGYLLNDYLSDAPDVVENVIDGETVNLGLGRIEDYQ